MHKFDLLWKSIQENLYVKICVLASLPASVYLLMVQFHAKDRESIRSNDCMIDIWYLSRSAVLAIIAWLDAINSY